MSDNKDYFSLMYENLSVLDNIANIMIESKSESITENNSEETTANESDIAAEEWSPEAINEFTYNRR